MRTYQLVNPRQSANPLDFVQITPIQRFSALNIGDEFILSLKTPKFVCTLTKKTSAEYCYTCGNFPEQTLLSDTLVYMLSQNAQMCLFPDSTLSDFISIRKVSLS